MNEPELPRPREVFLGRPRSRARMAGAEVRLHLNEWSEPSLVEEHLDDPEVRATILNRYGDSSAKALRAALADLWHVRAEEVLAGNGSMEIFLNTLIAYGGVGRTLLVFPPTYPQYRTLAEALGMRVASESAGIPYRLDAARARDAVERHRPDVLFICSPNNPTGDLVDPDAVLAAAEASPRTLVVVDEAYAEFVPTTILPHRLTHPNIVVAKTFSKIRGAAGLRIGALIGDPRVLEVFDVSRLPWSVDVVSQAIARRLAAISPALVEERTRRTADERERVFMDLAARPDIEVLPSVANFLMFRHRERPAASIHAALLERGVLIRDLSPWEGCDGWLRVTIGLPEENTQFLEALAAAAVPVAP